MSNNAFFALVLEFAQQRYASEVVLFWKELSQIQKGHPNAMPLQDFFATFLFDAESAMCVTVPHDVVEACKAAVDSGKPHLPKRLLDEAWHMIHNLLDAFWPLYTVGAEEKSN